MVYNMAWIIAKKQPGRNWVTTFIKRHKDTIKSSYIGGFDLKYKRADNWYLYNLYFE